mmetsp:Transcript_46052/g.108041  ORF Transcript_46052/g.108041 Transcript_46052/m.108041 type:complete len:153 (-) Transcript_46052:28-486(-)
MDKKLEKMEQKLTGVQPVEVAKTKKQLKAEKAAKKAEKKELRNQAAKSLDAANWTKEILNGPDAKFSGKVEASIDDKLSKATVGLVTYEQLKATKEALEQEANKSAADQAKDELKRKAEEDALEKESRKKAKLKQLKSKAALSFDLDGEEEA